MTGQTDNKAGFLTLGPSDNEVSTDYATKDGAHVIIFANKVSPDMVLVHQSKFVGFYKKLRSQDEVEPTPRSIKDLILKDTIINL
jgi:hypothetical protein